MSVVKINAFTVPRERIDEFELRFADRVAWVLAAEGIEAFELWRPNDGREVCLLYARWRSEEDFQAWVSREEGTSEALRRKPGPFGTTREFWSFDVLEHE